jgi:hypothetical protein
MSILTSALLFLRNQFGYGNDSQSEIEIDPLQALTKMTVEDLTALASDDVKAVKSFILDGISEETSSLISEILLKTESLSITSNAPEVLTFLSEISSLPAKNLVLSAKFPQLPVFPALDNLSIHESEAFENLAAHPQSLGNIKYLDIFDVDNAVLAENTREYSRLSQIKFNRCSLIDIENFYNESLNRVVAINFDWISTRRVMFHKDAAHGYFLTDPMSQTTSNRCIALKPRFYTLQLFGVVGSRIRPSYEEDLIAATGSAFIPRNSNVMEWTWF